METDIIVAIIGGAVTLVGAVLAGIIPFFLKRFEQTNDRIDDLFFYTMSGPMYANLRKRADGEFHCYEKPRGSGLERELLHLRDIGFVEMKDGHKLRGIPQTGDNLQDYVQVTDIGMRFVQRRKALDEQRKGKA